MPFAVGVERRHFLGLWVVSGPFRVRGLCVCCMGVSAWFLKTTTSGVSSHPESWRWQFQSSVPYKAPVMRQTTPGRFPSAFHRGAGCDRGFVGGNRTRLKRPPKARRHAYDPTNTGSFHRQLDSGVTARPAVSIGEQESDVAGQASIGRLERRDFNAAKSRLIHGSNNDRVSLTLRH